MEARNQHGRPTIRARNSQVSDLGITPTILQLNKIAPDFALASFYSCVDVAQGGRISVKIFGLSRK